MKEMSSAQRKSLWDLYFCVLAFLILFVLSVMATSGCTRRSSNDEARELWIYTSLYKDTIADMTPRLAKAFPDVKFHWFQAGSEEVGAKVNMESLSGGIQADILISSDRFWYEDMAKLGKLYAYKPKEWERVPPVFRNKDGFYATVSHPITVIAYNAEAVAPDQLPKTFRELAEPQWKNKATMPSPLASGTTFTLVSFLQSRYGWDFFKRLKDNGLIAEGGNGSVIRRLQNKERVVGAVLYENVIRVMGKDARIKAVFPEDGVILNSNVVAIVQKSQSRELAKQFVEWMFGTDGQRAMTHAQLSYSPLPGIQVPPHSPPFEQIRDKSFQWSDGFLASVVRDREKIKETFAQIFFN